MSEAEVKLNGNQDARVWADEFLKVFAKLYPASELPDHNWMLGWFANAIMSGYDYRGGQEDKQYKYILMSQGGAIVKIFEGQEPVAKDLDKAYANYLSCDTDAAAAEWNCVLYRYSKAEGLQAWNGKADTAYNWRSSP